MVTPLLYCTCMVLWSAVTPSVNSCEYSVNCIGNFIYQSRQNAYLNYLHNLFHASNCFFFGL